MQSTTRAVLSVLGQDHPGIVAGVATTLASAGANIDDIRQTILEGIFSMTMIITVDDKTCPFDDLQEKLKTISEDLGVQITLQREDVFRFMYEV